MMRIVSLYPVATTVADAVLGLTTRREHRHLDRVPATGPAVVVSNHVSVSDPLYPEGRITTEADYRPLAQARTGAVRLALAAGCPVVPVAQWGAHRLVTREHSSSLTRPLRWFGR